MCFTERKKKTRFGFQIAFFQKVHLEKGGSSYNHGRLIFRSIRYIRAVTILDFSSCLTGVRVEAQYCHLEVNQVLALEYLNVVLSVLFILNIAVIVTL